MTAVLVGIASVAVMFLNNTSLLAFSLVSLLWAINLIHYLVFTTAAGVAASFFYKDQRKNPVLGAVKRASTTSFGSVCLGLLVVTAVQTLRMVVDNISGSADNSCSACIVQVFVGIVEYLVGFITKFSFTFVASRVSHILASLVSAAI